MTPALPHSPISRRAVGVFACLLAVALSSVAPDRGAAGADDDARVEGIGVLVPDEELDPRVLALDLTGSGWTAAIDRFDRALFSAAENDRAIAAATGLLDELETEQRTLGASRRSLRRDDAAGEVELARVEAILQARALERYVHFGDEPLGALEDPSVATDQGRSEELARRVDEVQFSTRDELIEARDRRAERLAGVEGRLLEIEVALTSTRIRLDDGMARRDALEAEVDAATANVRATRRAARVPGYDFPVVALDAYLDAERLLAANWPSCHIRWWMIAGVARIESWHGQIGGRTLQAAGRPSRPIIGIALDGGPGVRAMYDTDDGRLDGDEVWDRAVGPLQFIPETWKNRGRDGSGDGVADPQNIYDAAYSAGRYLCAIGGDLSARAGLRNGYFGYNNSTEYVDAVIGWADRYSSLTLPAVVDAVENAG